MKKSYPVQLMSEKSRRKNKISILNGYKNGRVGYWKNKKRPNMSKWLKQAYKTGFKKVVIMRKEKNPAWKGDEASYSAIHHWLKTNFKKSNRCEHCGEKRKRCEWANISGKYRRNRKDYIQLCVKCHRKFDEKIPRKHSYKNYRKQLTR